MISMCELCQEILGLILSYTVGIDFDSHHQVCLKKVTLKQMSLHLFVHVGLQELYRLAGMEKLCKYALCVQNIGNICSFHDRLTR